jgi:hypothetical protein
MKKRRSWYVASALLIGFLLGAMFAPPSAQEKWALAGAAIGLVVGVAWDRSRS